MTTEIKMSSDRFAELVHRLVEHGFRHGESYGTSVALDTVQSVAETVLKNDPKWEELDFKVFEAVLRKFLTREERIHVEVTKLIVDISDAILDKSVSKGVMQ